MLRQLQRAALFLALSILAGAGGAQAAAPPAGSTVVTRTGDADPAKVCENGRPKRTLTAEEELRRATQRYADLVLAMDHAGIAALFTADGEVAAEGQPPIHGPAAIREHLESFKDFHVLAETLTPDEVVVAGDSGHVAGKYHQRVRIPSGEVVEVGGNYTADWVRDNAGAWHIRRMATVSKR